MKRRLGFYCASTMKRKSLRPRCTAIHNTNQRRRGRYCSVLIYSYILSHALIAAYLSPASFTNLVSTRTCKSAFETSTVQPHSIPAKPSLSISTALCDSSVASTTDVPSSSQEDENDGPRYAPPSSVEELLRIYDYGQRIVQLDFDTSDGHLIGQRVVHNAGKDDEESFIMKANDGVFAEVQDGGRTRICRIHGIKTNEKHDNLTRPPLLNVVFLDDSESGDDAKDPEPSIKTIDMGQITTVWSLPDDNGDSPLASSSTEDICAKVEQILPVNYVDQTFENRYKYHVSRGRNVHGGGALTKKQVLMIGAAASVAASSSASTFEQTEELRKKIDLILKQCVRCGSKYTRLLDSSLLEEWMFYDTVEGTITHDYTAGSDTTLCERRIFCAKALAKDNEIAGRFKRMSCMWLPPAMPDSENDTDSSSQTSTTSLTIVNGGWIVVDQSVRAAAEGRRFAAAALASGGKFENDSNNERILCRLESLACGEKLKQQKRGGGDGIRLEVDVRTVLEAMNLPLSSEGAQKALFQMGRWTKKDSGSEDEKGNLQYERWSPSVLEASKWYVEMDRVRRREMKSRILELRDQEKSKTKTNRGKKSKNIPSDDPLEGRVDLTNLPCICVDAERTSFRDDAFGIRKRSTTGRKVSPEASQWELLFHIADVSDIYAPEPTVLGSPWASGTTKGQQTTSNTSLEDQRMHLKELESAARSRIRSEYNLPLGPLHLLPTDVLDTLSLDAFKQDWTSKPNTWPSSWHTMDKDNGTVNRAITLWVYIDERSGYVMDIGLERSIISRPLALTFGTAAKLLDASKREQEKLPPMLAKARVLLNVVERNIEIWSDNRRRKSDEARDREEKLAAREMISNQVFGGKNNRWKRRDDGRDGDFRRDRGHRLVDSTLNLYENALRMMLHRKKAMIPQHPVSSNKSGGMRSASAPLRNYLQGLAQRQMLAVLCDYSGPPMTNEQCKKTGSTITSAYNARQNTSGATKGPRAVAPRQLAAVRSLQSHLRRHSSSQTRLIPAISTGKNSEVVIQGVGAVAFCKEIPGTIKPGVKVMVRILSVDEKNGKVVVALQSEEN